MKRLLFAAALPLVGCATVHPVSTASPATLPRRALVQQILSENVRLMIYEGQELRRTASGVVVAAESTPEGAVSYVLTNAHVADASDLKEARLSAVTDRPGGDALEYRAEVVALGRVPEMDLAVVRIWGVLLPPAQLAEEADLTPGDSVIVAGAPFGRPISVSGGLVSQVELDAQTRRPSMLKTDAPIGYGASGGGIYSLDTGRLLAIVEGYRTAKVGFEVAAQTYSFDVPMPGETFGAPVAKVRDFLKAKGLSRLLEPSSPPQAASR
jgi:serine protease Do